MARGRYTSGSTVKTVVRAAVIILASLALIGFCLVRWREKRHAAASVSSVEGLFAVYFIDVGQGDACLVRSPSGHYMFIDAGPTENAPSTVQFLRSHGVDKLEVLLLTHPHEDHFGGMTQIIETFDIARFITHRGFADMYPVTRFRTMLDDDTDFVGIAAGETFSFDGILIEVLSPKNVDPDDPNESSLCLKLTYGDTSFLFTADIGNAAENALLACDADLHADVLKVAHHGSSASSSAAFLDAVQPSAAVISVGAGNDYGHPSSNTLRTLEARGTDIYRTDQCGSVLFVSNGTGVYHMTMDKKGVYASPLADAA